MEQINKRRTGRLGKMEWKPIVWYWRKQRIWVGWTSGMGWRMDKRMGRMGEEIRFKEEIERGKIYWNKSWNFRKSYNENSYGKKIRKWNWYTLNRSER